MPTHMRLTWEGLNRVIMQGARLHVIYVEGSWSSRVRFPLKGATRDRYTEATCLSITSNKSMKNSDRPWDTFLEDSICGPKSIKNLGKVRFNRLAVEGLKAAPPTMCMAPLRNPLSLSKLIGFYVRVQEPRVYVRKNLATMTPIQKEDSAGDGRTKKRLSRVKTVFIPIWGAAFTVRSADQFADRSIDYLWCHPQLPKSITEFVSAEYCTYTQCNLVVQMAAGHRDHRHGVASDTRMPLLTGMRVYTQK